MSRRRTLPGTKFKQFVSSSQAAVERVRDVMPGMDRTAITVAKVTAVYMDRNTVDVISNNGQKVRNVPMLSRIGLEAEEVWGTLELPSVDDYVVIGFITDMEDAPFVFGTLVPFTYSKYQSEQTAANSGSKAETLKLLEDVDPKYFRKIFKSGTTIEVQADGTIILETPDGTIMKIDATAGTVEITSTSDITITDGNGNDITMGTSSVTINGNLEVLQ